MAITPELLVVVSEDVLVEEKGSGEGERKDGIYHANTLDGTRVGGVRRVVRVPRDFAGEFAEVSFGGDAAEAGDSGFLAAGG